MSTPKRPTRPRDFNQAAHQIFLESIGERPKTLPSSDQAPQATAPPAEPKPEKNPVAVAFGMLGASKGGKARAAKLTPEQRKEAAKKAAAARWAKNKG